MNIEIDFDVYKELTLRRSTEKVSYNDVLRELLGLSLKKSSVTSEQISEHEGWISKGVVFPNGTEFRARYKGKQYCAKIKDEGLVMDNKHFSSFSAAARKITSNSVDGWRFWECRMPGKDWQMIISLRKEVDIVTL